MDPIGKTVKVVDHNRWTVIGIVVGLVLTGLIIGCGILEGKAIDPTTGKSATADVIAANVNADLNRMDLEIDLMIGKRNAQAEAGGVAVEQANAITERNYAMVDAGTNLLLQNPIVAASGVGTVLTGAAGLLGLWRDNRRKDVVIKEVKTKNTTS